MTHHPSRLASWTVALAILSLGVGGCLIPPPGGSPPVTRKLRNGSAAGPPIPADGGGVFELAWQDDFDKLDESRWRLMNHSFGSNLAIFSPSNVRFDRGILNLDLRPAPKDHDKPFRGVEMRSVEALTYGKVEARARFARGSAVVPSLVTGRSGIRPRG
jgi:beta-glucanase (GH16 family)